MRLSLIFILISSLLATGCRDKSEEFAIFNEYINRELDANKSWSTATVDEIIPALHLWLDAAQEAHDRLSFFSGWPTIWLANMRLYAAYTALSRDAEAAFHLDRAYYAYINDVSLSDVGNDTGKFYTDWIFLETHQEPPEWLNEVIGDMKYSNERSSEQQFDNPGSDPQL